MLIQYDSSKEQIQKIYKKYLRVIFNVKFSLDKEDNIEFIWCTTNPLYTEHEDAVKSGIPILQWQVRTECPCFFSLQKGDVAYNIDFPEGLFKQRLMDITKKAKKKFWEGAQL